MQYIDLSRNAPQGPAKQINGPMAGKQIQISKYRDKCNRLQEF